MTFPNKVYDDKNKSYVTMEQKLCPVCGKPHDSGAILIDQRLRKQFDMKTTTGYGFCDECKSKKDAGYVALIVADTSKSSLDDYGTTVKMENAHRTGEIIHMKNEVAKKVFTGIDVEKNPFVFIDIEAAQKIKNMQKMSIQNSRKQPLRRDERVLNNKIKRPIRKRQRFYDDDTDSAINEPEDD